MTIYRNSNKKQYVSGRNRSKKYSPPYRRFSFLLNSYLSRWDFGKYYWRKPIEGFGYQTVGNNDYQQDYGFHFRTGHLSATAVFDGHGKHPTDLNYHPHVGRDFCDWIRPKLLDKMNNWKRSLGTLPTRQLLKDWWQKELDWLELLDDFEYYLRCGTTVAIALCDHTTGNVLTLQFGDSEIYFGTYRVENKQKIRDVGKELKQRFDLRITNSGKRINHGPNTLSVGDWFYYGTKERHIEVIKNMVTVREYIVKHKTPIICMTDGVYDWVKYTTDLIKYPINNVWKFLMVGSKPQEIARNLIEGSIYLGLRFGRSWAIKTKWGPEADNMTAIVGVI